MGKVQAGHTLPPDSLCLLVISAYGSVHINSGVPQLKEYIYEPIAGHVSRYTS